LTYAVLSTFDVSKDLTDGGYSEHTEVSGVIPYIDKVIKIDSDLTESVPYDLLGDFIPSIERQPSTIHFNFLSNEDSYVTYSINPTSKLEIGSDYYFKLKKAETMSASYDKNNIDLYLPDNGYYRGVRFSRGSIQDCEKNYKDSILLQTCKSMVFGSPLVPLQVFGQKSPYLKSKASFLEEEKDMDDSRKFVSRHFYVGYGISGQKYLFVSDEQRILVRIGDIESCYSDIGEKKSTPRLSGSCGFDISIGTKSPKQRCPFKKTLNGPSKLSYDESCGESDYAYSISDELPPTNYSLRFPGKVLLNGDDLYIPDSGNSRVLKISNFETKIKSCGRLGSSCNYSDEASCKSDSDCSWEFNPNNSKCKRKDFEYCTFDDVLGQYKDVSNPLIDRFGLRACLRGGENNFKDLSKNEVGFTKGPLKDETNLNQKIGFNCLLDTVKYNDNGSNYLSKKVVIENFEGEAFSEINPQTARVSEITQRMFRNPISIETDTSGRLYVLDLGNTIVKRQSTNLVAGIPNRVMVWEKNPFSYLTCPKNSPPAIEGGCDTLADNSCVGSTCIARPCEGIECNASFIAGQPSPALGLKMPDSKLFSEFKNGEIPSYLPIANMAVGKTESMKGLWIVTGEDSKVYRFKSLSYSEKPEIYNNKIFDSSVPCKNESILINTGCDYSFYKTGVFNSINLDEYNGELFLWNSEYMVGYGWRAK